MRGSLLLLGLLLVSALAATASDWRKDYFGPYKRRLAKSDLYMLVFASSSCPACRDFYPQMVRALGKRKPAESASVMIIPRDSSQPRYKNHQGFLDVSWTRLPFNTSEGEWLNNHFNVAVLPTVIVLDADGKVVDEEGYWAVMALSGGVFDYWRGVRDGKQERVNHREAITGVGGSMSSPDTLKKLQPVESKAKEQPSLPVRPDPFSTFELQRGAVLSALEALEELLDQDRFWEFRSSMLSYDSSLRGTLEVEEKGLFPLLKKVLGESFDASTLEKDVAETRRLLTVMRKSIGDDLLTAFANWKDHEVASTKRKDKMLLPLMNRLGKTPLERSKLFARHIVAIYDTMPHPFLSWVGWSVKYLSRHGTPSLDKYLATREFLLGLKSAATKKQWEAWDRRLTAPCYTPVLKKLTDNDHLESTGIGLLPPEVVAELEAERSAGAKDEL